MSIPRPEHPRPQFVRDSWLSLNGPWTCHFDQGKSGLERGLQHSQGFEQPVMVPFCPESRLSGIGHTDFIECLWYHRKLEIPAEWENQLVLLHFGAVDYECFVYIDGQEACHHIGGLTSFTADISSYAQAGKCHELVLQVKDEQRSGNQPYGKQSPWFKSQGCSYTRTSGIWQSVWLEAVPKYGLKSCKIVADIDRECLLITPEYHALKANTSLIIDILADGEIVNSAAFPCVNGSPLQIDLPNPILWEPGNPFLYEIVLELFDEDDELVDSVKSYAGMRKVHIEGERIFLNNQPIFLRLVLDQGFYEEGIWTAPSDEALRQDIVLAMQAGFNGARLHQKVFEERFHYWADKLGYLTWAEFADWGIGFWRFYGSEPVNLQQGLLNFMSEWRAVVQRDMNHPSIIAWTPLNETRNYQCLKTHRQITNEIYALTKALDPSRPVNDNSGYVHVCSDLWTVHNYTQDAAELIAQLRPKEYPVAVRDAETELFAYKGQPYIVDEYGGVKFIPEDRQAFADNSWGYGQEPASRQEAYDRIRELTAALLSMPELSGYCYTQLTDIEQEQNGIYNYDRSTKFDMDEINSVFSQKPEWSHY